jgi:ABC-type sugar transport system permease subunit
VVYEVVLVEDGHSNFQDQVGEVIKYWDQNYTRRFDYYSFLTQMVPHIPLIGKFMEWVGASTALNMIIIADTWKVTPLVTLLVLSALQTIPDSYYEAAGIDGANGWSQFWKITLPLLRPVLLVVLVLRTMELFGVFEIIYILM